MDLAKRLPISESIIHHAHIDLMNQYLLYRDI